MISSRASSPADLTSPQGTPQLTINHEATVDLDSTNAFEGPEKLLEVWFAPSPDALPITAAENGLQSVSAATWKGMLDLVHCEVLSVAEAEDLDAYLLSESSMFVFPHKLILKTCGTTTLLYGIPRLLEIAAVSAGFPRDSSAGPDKIAAMTYRVFYSRKNFMFPGKQVGPHKSWSSEVKCLDEIFNGGSAYMVGKMNGDHWYLYLTAPNPTLTPPATPSEERSTETKLLHYPGTKASKLATGALATDDETLEVLMTDLESEDAKQFYLDHASAVAQGQFSKRANEARREAVARIGDLTDVGGKMDLSLSTTTAGSVSTPDEVFSTAASSSAATPDEEELIFPEELSAEGHALGTVVSEACGLSDVYPLSRYPDARVDAYIFTPCGFSANGIVPSPSGKGTNYFTVHVAPEPQNSYASFETNVPSRQTGRETRDVIEQVVNIFKPGRFSVTLFEATVSNSEAKEMRDMGLVPEGCRKALDQGLRRSVRMDAIRGYTRLDRIVHDLNGYELVFSYFERDDWKGGVSRLGEPDF